MIPREKLLKIRRIITHENCPDGVASAMILKDVLPEAEVTFCYHSSPQHKELVPEEGLLFCDFSPHVDRPALPVGRPATDGELMAFAAADKEAKQRLDEFVAAGAIVLDHHRTQRDIVERFGDLGVFGDEETQPGVCGAVLAYREVWLPLRGTSRFNAPSYHQEVEKFATLAGIRDTWQKHSPQWQAACEQAEALQFWPVEELLGLPPEKWPSKLELGPVLFKRKLKSAQKAIDGGWLIMTPKGTRVLVFEGTRQTSDAAELLGDKVDLVVGFNYRIDDGQLSIIYSTRSHTGYDCSAYAKSHPGGGGHKAAAGFTLPLQVFYETNPYKLLWDDLNAYEGKSPEQEWHITLNKYQRDNLVWLLAACGYPAQEVEGCIEPFTYANTGDWLGEVAIKLNYEDGVGSPNMSLEELRKLLSR